MIAFEEVVRLLEEYKEQYGDCKVPFRYITKDGINLGSIVNTIRSGGRKTSTEQKAILNSIGFVWKVIESHFSFEEVIRLLKDYKEKRGDLLVPNSYTTEDGINLGMLVNSIRSGNRKTSADEKEMLDNLGFVWQLKEKPCSFEEVVRLIEDYKEQYGDCKVSCHYITKDGIHLGNIVTGIRCGQRKITTEQKEMLDSLGFAWRLKNRNLSFEEVIKLLQDYKEQHGNCLVPRWYTTEEGINLGKIVNSIRIGNRQTSTEEKAILNELGFVWNIRESSLSFSEVVRLLENYKEQFGNCEIPCHYITEDGIRLGKIVSRIRNAQRKTSIEEKEVLDSLGFVWKGVKGRRKK